MYFNSISKAKACAYTVLGLLVMIWGILSFKRTINLSVVRMIISILIMWSGAAVFGVFIRVFFRKICYTPEEIIEMDRRCKIDKKDERNELIRNKAGRRSGLIINVIWFGLVVILANIYNNIVLLIIAAFIFAAGSVLQSIFSNYFEKRI